MPFSATETVQTSIHTLDILGTLAFAGSGAMLAVRKRFDLFGVIVLGSVTAMGGGAVRDVLLDRTPVFLRDESYIMIALLGSLLAFALGERLARFEKGLNLLDSLGLAVFATSGALGAKALGFGPLGVAFAGMLSGVGGGIIRDLLANEVPEVMYRKDQLYATAAAMGAATTGFLVTQFGNMPAQLGGITVVLLLRYLSQHSWMNLPVRRINADKS